jgi:sulfide:quinone oxidoreductase
MTPLRVLIAGGGVAALETVLALRALAEDDVAITLLAPNEQFSYRPLAVAEPFGAGKVQRFDLEPLAAAAGATVVRGALRSVDPDRKRVMTTHGPDLDYDVLVVAVGVRPREALPGALTFRGEDDVNALRALLADAGVKPLRRIAFAVPAAVTWPLPLYELALQSAVELRRSGAATEVVLLTHEDEPLALFGSAGSTRVRELLAERGIALRTSCLVQAFARGWLLLVPDDSLRADAAVAMPRLVAPRIPGLPQRGDGYVPVDEQCRVHDLEDVFAVGDVTEFPVKQGGIAAEQADAAATAIASLAGAPVEPEPFRPVLRALLLTGGPPEYLRADLTGGAGDTSAVSPDPLWWPPAKIAGRHLAPFLASWTGLAFDQSLRAGQAVAAEGPGGPSR